MKLSDTITPAFGADGRRTVGQQMSALNPHPARISRLAADGLLLITACLWGVTFVAQKDAVGVLPPLAYVASRFAVSALALAPLALFEQRSARRKAAPGAMKLAFAIGLSLFSRNEPAAGGLEEQRARPTAGFSPPAMSC